MKKVVLITGASSGIGKETAKVLHENGFIVYGAARRLERMDELKTLGIKVIAMDVTNDESMVAGVDTILKKEGRIDVLVNNAGYGSYGSVEDVPLDEARRQFEVNIFGLARLCQLVLPSMRNNKHGKIVNISSMGGKIYTPLGAWYHGTKHALEGFSDCLRVETKQFGVDVIIIEPGGIKTEWGDIAIDNMMKTSGTTAYGSFAEKVARMFNASYEAKGVSEPIVIAKTILKAITAKKPKTRYAAGYMAKPYLFLRKILPDKVFDAILLSTVNRS